jgi:hypothetical protein
LEGAGREQEGSRKGAGGSKEKEEQGGERRSKEREERARLQIFISFKDQAFKKFEKYKF